MAIIGGRYLIEQKIGDGAFSDVFRGRDLRLNLRVAIKILRNSPGTGDLSWAQLLSEGHSISALSHPNICRILDMGEDEERSFFIIEFIEGRTLREILMSGPLPIRYALQTALDISRGLAHAHSAGIIHQDLTPSNVMLDSTGRIKIIDFGLAKAATGDDISSATKSQSSIADVGWVKGKLPYVSPEILYGQGASVQTDLWSLGAILYEMLTGHPPFQGRTLFEASTSIMLGKPVPACAGIPASTRAIVFRCLSTRRDSRYRSANELCRHLEGEIASTSGAHRSPVSLLIHQLQRVRTLLTHRVY